MSRMILALVSMALLSGCQYSSNHRRISLVSARFATVGPNWSLYCPAGSGCDDCIPHRPLTHKYIPAWDHWISQHTAHCCAFRAFCAYRDQCGCPVSHHFKMGFITAYEDLALNRRPSPPIVPPPRYWNAFYRSCAGRPDVEDWFAGYDAGLETGSNSGVARFHEVYLRRTGCQNGYGQYGNGLPSTNGDPSFDQPDGGIAPGGVPFQGMPTPMAPQAAPYSTMDAQGTFNPYGAAPVAPNQAAASAYGSRG